MITSKTNMQEPKHIMTWVDILNFAQSITPWFVLGAVFWRLIDKVVKYFAEGREAQFNDIVKTQITATVSPEIKELREAIKDLTKSIGALEKKTNG